MNLQHTICCGWVAPRLQMLRPTNGVKRVPRGALRPLRFHYFRHRPAIELAPLEPGDLLTRPGGRVRAPVPVPHSPNLVSYRRRPRGDIEASPRRTTHPPPITGWRPPPRGGQVRRPGAPLPPRPAEPHFSARLAMGSFADPHLRTRAGSVFCGWPNCRLPVNWPSSSTSTSWPGAT